MTKARYRNRAMPLLLRVREVAALLAVSEREVWAMLQAGELTRVKAPGRRLTRVAREDVERLVQRWRAKSNDESPQAM